LHENIFVCGRYERGDSSLGRSVDVMKYDENPFFDAEGVDQTNKENATPQNSTNSEGANVILFGEENKNLPNRRYRLQVCQLFDGKLKTLRYSPLHNALSPNPFHLYSPLNKFNSNGEQLASGAAGVALLWEYSYSLNPSKPQQPAKGMPKKKQPETRRTNSGCKKRKADEKGTTSSKSKKKEKGPPLKKKSSSAKLFEQFAYKGGDKKGGGGGKGGGGASKKTV